MARPPGRYEDGEDYATQVCELFAKKTQLLWINLILPRD